MIKALLKDSVVYGAANAVQKLVPFFVVPIVIHQLGQTALKVYDVSFVYAYLFSWLIILGQDTAASVFYFEKKNNESYTKQVLGYALLVQLTFLMLLMIVVLPFKQFVASWLFKADPYLKSFWVKALLVIPGHMVFNYALNILLWQRRKAAYISLCICQTALSLASVFITVVVLDAGLPGLFYSLIGSTATSAIIGLLMVKRQLQFPVYPLDGSLVKKLILFGAPFALTSFFHQLLPAIDRYFLLQYGQQLLMPQYILAVKLGGLMSMGIGAFGLAFTPYSLARINEPGAEKELSHLFQVVAVAGFILIPVMLLFKDLMVWAFADASFAFSARLIPFFFFGWMFDLFAYFSMLGVYKAQNSMLILLLFAGSIALVSVLNLLLIPRLGVYGAALAFCITKGALFLAPLFYLRRYFKLTIHAKSFVTAFVVALAASYFIYQVTWGVALLPVALLVGATVFYLFRQHPQLLLLQKQIPS